MIQHRLSESKSSNFLDKMGVIQTGLYSRGQVDEYCISWMKVKFILHKHTIKIPRQIINVKVDATLESKTDVIFCKRNW